jgi:hypothetical protein
MDNPETQAIVGTKHGTQIFKQNQHLNIKKYLTIIWWNFCPSYEEANTYTSIILLPVLRFSMAVPDLGQ